MDDGSQSLNNLFNIYLEHEPALWGAIALPPKKWSRHAGDPGPRAHGGPPKGQPHHPPRKELRRAPDRDHPAATVQKCKSAGGCSNVPTGGDVPAGSAGSQLGQSGTSSRPRSLRFKGGCQAKPHQAATRSEHLSAQPRTPRATNAPTVEGISHWQGVWWGHTLCLRCSERSGV